MPAVQLAAMTWHGAKVGGLFFQKVRKEAECGKKKKDKKNGVGFLWFGGRWEEC